MLGLRQRGNKDPSRQSNVFGNHGFRYGRVVKEKLFNRTRGFQLPMISTRFDIKNEPSGNYNEDLDRRPNREVDWPSYSVAVSKWLVDQVGCNRYEIRVGPGGNVPSISTSQ